MKKLTSLVLATGMVLSLAVSGCLRRLRQLHGCKHHQHR